MWETISEIWLCMLVAAALGFIMGRILGKERCAEAQEGDR